MKVKTRMLAAVVAGLMAASISGVAAQESESGAALPDRPASDGSRGGHT